MNNSKKQKDNQVSPNQDYFCLTKEQKDDLLKNFDELNVLCSKIEKTRTNIAQILSNLDQKQLSQKYLSSKIPGGGKIVLINGEFKKVFGVLLNALKNKQLKDGKELHFFTNYEYDELFLIDKDDLVKDPRNISWEPKNYYVKNRIKKKSASAISPHQDENSLNGQLRLDHIRKHIEHYKISKEKLEQFFSLFSNEKKIPIPSDINQFQFDEKNKNIFSQINSTKEWTKFELFFMDLYEQFSKNIDGYKEECGIPYISVELAKKIVTSNLNLRENQSKEILILIENFILSKKEENDLNELIRKTSHTFDVKNLVREDYFALSRILHIPIFDFYEKFILPITNLQNSSPSHSLKIASLCRK